MRKVVLSLLPILILMLAITACSSPRQSSTETEFGRILSYMPASALKARIWYTDIGKVKQLNRAEEWTTLDEFYNPPGERSQYAVDWSPLINILSRTGPQWTRIALSDFIGFDIMGVDRIAYTQWYPGFSILEARFDKKKIAGLLTGPAYEQTEYGDYSYFDIRNDNRENSAGNPLPVPEHIISQIAVWEDRIIIASSTQKITGILDAISGKEPVAADVPGVLTVANNLDNVLCAFIMLAEDVFPDGIPYHFTIPSDWGQMHQYTVAGMGYRNKGQNTYIDIVLYYRDIAAARADSEEIVTRVKSYLFNTQQSLKDGYPFQQFNDVFELEKPAVKAEGDGAVLKLSCRLVPEERKGMRYIIDGMSGVPDVLFLAPDPARYVAP